MTCFNHATFVREALASVESQTFRDFELIIVDDGSTDQTAMLVQQWLDLLPEARKGTARMHAQPNAGQSAALEAGFNLCGGDYIALLDSDDRWLPTKLQAVMEIAGANQECGLIVHPQRVIDPTGMPTGDLRPKGARLSHGDLREEMRRSGRHVAGATSCQTYRRDIFASLLPMPTRGLPSAADQYLSFGATFMAPVFALEQPLSEYRVHPDGNYIRRMTSIDGIARQVALQRMIAAHFGVAHVVRRNSFFARNEFAATKLTGGVRSQWQAFKILIGAILADRSFGVKQKSALAGFWTLGMTLPGPLFLRLWTWFQRVQTGRQRAFTKKA